MIHGLAFCYRCAIIGPEKLKHKIGHKTLDHTPSKPQVRVQFGKVNFLDRQISYLWRLIGIWKYLINELNISYQVDKEKIY